MSWNAKFGVATLILATSLACHAQGKDPLDAWNKGARFLAVTQPDYPSDALAKGVQGTLVVEFGLDATGHPRDIAIVHSEPKGVFDEAILSVLQKWRLLPKREAPCTIDHARIRQQFWFDIAEGKPKVTMSKLIEQPVPVPFDANENFISTGRQSDVVKKTKPEEFVNLGAIPSVRFKKGTEPAPTYAMAARHSGTGGIVIAKVVFRPDGMVDQITIPYSFPNSAFAAAAEKSLVAAQIETLAGGPPGEVIRGCIPFVLKTSTGR